MTEVSFARTFLSALDAKPTKIPADHVEDPRSYPSRPPSILPRSARPFAPSPSSNHPSGTSSSSSSGAPGSEPSLTVTLKSLRNPPLDVRLTSQPPSTSVLEMKHAVSARTGLPVDKMRLLHKKKPVADSKVLKDLVEGAGQTEIDLGVMVLGGAAAALGSPPPPSTGAGAAAAAGGGGGGGGNNAAQGEEKAGDKHVAVGPHGTDVLRTEEFWTDLGGYLQQRMRDEAAAGEVLGKFRRAWEGR